MNFKSAAEAKKFSDTLKWPELKSAWILLGILAVVFILGFIFLPALVAFIEGGLLMVTGGISFALIYRAAKSERAGRLEKSELANILLGLDDALVVYDHDFNILFFNPAAENLFKTKSEDIVGQKFQPQDVGNESKKLLAQVIFSSLAPTVISRSRVGEYPQIVDISFTDPELELRVSTIPVRGELNELLGFMKIIRDRTREISLIKSKGEFLTVASHQLRTPVTDINWALQSLASDESLNENAKTIVETALTAGRNLFQVVEDLLDVAKIEEGHFGYKFEQVDIVQFINEVLGTVMPMSERAGIKIYFEKPKNDLPQPFIDRTKLSRALDNLIENSVRYNTENGEVIVRVEKVSDGPFLEISVKDTGIGIAPADIDNLFKKFYRASNAVKTQTEGTGLGLYIVKNIVQAHGGKIWVDSEPGRGSVFHFTIATDINSVPQHEMALEE